MWQEFFFAGVRALVDYVATHTLTCLVPAFFLAGAMVTFVDRETVLDHLGAQVNRLKSFSLASISSFFIAACSCTVIPVASGLYYSGAGIGAAFIVLWVAPATNILALVYTGNILGIEMAVSRVVAALLMAFMVGFVMSYTFRDEAAAAPPQRQGIPKKGIITKSEFILLALLVISLLAPNYLVQSGPYLTKVLVWGAISAVVAIYSVMALEKDRMLAWLRETWWFTKTIFPLLLGGVFIVGIIGEALPEEMIKEWLGGNSLRASFLATLLGGVTYFATMTEAPFVDTLMKLGMGKGPALALLLTGPGLSLPNWLAIARIFGLKKALVYIPTVMISGAFMGWLFGNFIL
ncbi:MAG: permease [Nitrospinota bacterium]|nr:permease [Nitrospinota bacterium]